jgi:membrane-associated phospholipid phosphatase
MLHQTIALKPTMASIKNNQTNQSLARWSSLSSRSHSAPPHTRLNRLAATCLLAGLASTSVLADYEEEIETSTRLSAWLTERMTAKRDLQRTYLAGMVWSVQEETAAQARAKSALIARLMQTDRPQATEMAALERLLRLIETLPVTGRVVLEKTDPRWLEVNPDKDPVLQKGHRIKLIDRPETVSLVFGDGQVCHVRHDATLYDERYAEHCNPDASLRWVWIIQPDGAVQRAGISAWNQSHQDTPAPGAWILVEDSRYPWNQQTYGQIARLLATQGPALVGPNAAILKAPTKRSGLLTGLYQSGTPVDLKVSSSDWGGIGLLQTPTARMAPAGTASVSINQSKPYTRLNFNLQPFDWLETSFRYLDVSNRLYGPSIAGTQSYKDKSIDVKFKLTAESNYFPETAVGIRDLTGTGLFSGEYLVASKRTGHFDWSLGVGWGYLGARGDLKNPLSFLGKSLKTRPTETESAVSGGEVNLSTYFHGPAALFGGVQYQTPWEDLILKLEYDGNDYQHEPKDNNQKQDSPFNLGAVWRYSDNLDLNLGWERGNTLMLGASFHGRLDRINTPKINDPKQITISNSYPVKDHDWPQLAAELEKSTGWRVQQLLRSGSELIVKFDQVDVFHWNDFIDRIAAILHRDVSNRAVIFRVQSVDNDLRLSEHLIDRRTWVEAKTRYLPPHEKQPAVLTTAYGDGLSNPFSEVLLETPEKQFKGDYGLYFKQSLGGPDGFILYQLGGRATGTWQPRTDTWLTGVLRAGLLDNYDKFKYEPPTVSSVPRVRTHIREYITTADLTLPILQLTHVGKLGANQYYSIYGGMLESMFGGVGAEWLYRPFGSQLALGVDINAVKQRGFEQDFSFRDYQTTTGHVSLYWDTGIQDIQATLQAGRYLARDVGVTVDLARVFDNGVKMGAWFTKTDMSAKEFGEGSFDKGIYVDIPFDAMMTSSSSSIANLIWQPLLRDGGARLNRSVTLDELTRAAKGDALRWRPFSAARKTQFGDVDDPDGEAQLSISFWDAGLEDLSVLGRGLGYADFWKSVAIAGGITALSSALDKPADKLARDHGDSKPMRGIEKVGNLLPLAMIGFSGAMALNDDDPRMARASFASLGAGGVAAASAFGLKYALGRSRPDKNLGPTEFSPFSKGNGDSSLPSIHSAVAWATLTPYAKAYDAPWLYGLASLTNIARIGKREHWLSDTVGGALIGYGLGSLFWESRRSSKATPSLYVTPGEIGLEWKTH